MFGARVLTAGLPATASYPSPTFRPPAWPEVAPDARTAPQGRGRQEQRPAAVRTRPKPRCCRTRWPGTPPQFSARMWGKGRATEPGIAVGREARRHANTRVFGRRLRTEHLAARGGGPGARARSGVPVG